MGIEDTTKKISVHILKELVKFNDKDTFYMYYIVDVFPTKRIYAQGLEKIRTYQKKKDLSIE